MLVRKDAFSTPSAGNTGTLTETVTETTEVTEIVDELLELLRAARQKNGSAKEELCLRFLPLIRSASLKYRVSGSVDSLDLLQEAHEAFLLCIEQFEEERGVGFAHFAKQRVYARLWTVVRREQTIQSRMLSASSSVTGDRIRHHGSGFQSGPEFDLDLLAQIKDPMADRQYQTSENRLDLQPAMLLLTVRERIAVQALLEGRPLKELAPVYGVSVETVKTWRKRAFRKLRKHWPRGE